MDIRINRTTDALNVELNGELDHHAAGRVLSRIGELSSAALPSRCTLDMSGVGFMDSSGIAVVLGLHRVVRETGGELTVTHVPGQAMRVFAASGLTKILNFE